MRYARCFSARNGFGPVPTRPTIVTTDDINLKRFRDLHMLLTDITAAEEAAIRQICPLICIKSLRGGNIAAKGNTHCVWQQCNLVTILPNLPGEIKYIIIRRSQNATTSDERTIRSTRFEREKILALLMLLKATCKPWTDIEIDEDQVNAWPV